MRLTDDPTLREIDSAALTSADAAGLRALVAEVWPAVEFTEDDFAHALGGRHWVLESDGWTVGHASVVGRQLHVGEGALRTG